ncbi:MAG: response regulator [Vicinamibacterales bacterium]
MPFHKTTRDTAVHLHDTPRVLLIQQDRTIADTFTAALSSLDVESSWAQSGLEGLARARLTRFDLLFVDLELPDIPGLAVINAVRATDERARFVIVSGSLPAGLIRDALDWGALGVLVKPFSESEVISAVRRAFRFNGSPTGDAGEAGLVSSSNAAVPWSVQSGPGSVAERWAGLILKTIYADVDPKTIGVWARSIGVSRSTLCECCRLMHVSPHDARDFARLMRAVYRSGRSWQPEALLDLADARTLKKLLARAGLSGASAKPPSTREFLDRQKWIPRSNPGLATLRAVLLGEHESDAPLDRMPSAW